MEKSDFDKLLDRYLTDELSTEERLKVDAWLDLKKTEDAAIELSQEDQQQLFLLITNRINSADDIKKFNYRRDAILPKRNEAPALAKIRARKDAMIAAERNGGSVLYSNTQDKDQGNQKSQVHYRPALKIAASIALLLVISYGIWSLVFRSSLQHTIAANAIEKIILADHSIVWLHKGSELTWSTSGEAVRHVQLRGEALFEITKDPAHPFTVSSGEITATVLGTSFTIKTAAEKIELSVLTGKVNLSSSKDKKGIDVLPNEKVIYTPSGMEGITTTLTSSDITTLTASTEYLMNFDNTPLAIVLQQIQKKFNVTIKYDENFATQCPITADLTDRSLENTLFMMADLLDMKHKINGTIVTLSGNGCE